MKTICLVIGIALYALFCYFILPGLLKEEPDEYNEKLLGDEPT